MDRSRPEGNPMTNNGLRHSQTISLKERFQVWAMKLREQTKSMEPRHHRLLASARPADRAACNIDAWLASPGLQPPS